MSLGGGGVYTCGWDHSHVLTHRCDCSERERVLGSMWGSARGSSTSASAVVDSGGGWAPDVSPNTGVERGALAKLTVAACLVRFEEQALRRGWG